MIPPPHSGEGIPAWNAPERIEHRRTTFFFLLLAITGFAGLTMADFLARTGFGFPQAVVLGLYVLLIANSAFGFCQGLIGLVLTVSRTDAGRITATIAEVPPERAPAGRTAVVIPVYNESVDKVFSRVKTTFAALQSTGHGEHFDIIILSDSMNPNVWVEEETAWIETVKELNAPGRILYRKRRANINKKSGNISDFCRRWGHHYAYMICLDADSLMTGAALLKLVRMMEANPRVGIIQTAPGLMNAETLFSRVQQFASRFHSELSNAGLNFWQQDTGNYWGHNAIIRLAPFIRHCALPELPGREPFGGRILSHDFVEAALMRRAGYEVWLAHDLEGSHEETPPNLIDMAKRDNRWCQGNLQHSWLLFARGLRPCNRGHLAMGIMAYGSSFLWLVFLLVSTAIAYRVHISGLSVIAAPSALPLATNLTLKDQAVLLAVLSLGLILLPKAFTLIAAAADPERTRLYGGWLRATLSVLLEVLFFTLLSPVLMILHSSFVLNILLGKGVQWNAQNRDGGNGTPWGDAFAALFGQMILAGLWGTLAWIVSPVFFAWLSPIFLGWLLAPVLCVWSSRPGVGQRAAALGLFLTPEETQPEPEVTDLRGRLWEAERRPRPIKEVEGHYGLIQVVLDPYINAVHTTLLRNKDDAPMRAHFAQLRERVLRDGPQSLNRKEALSLLSDAESCVLLHNQLWTEPVEQLADSWRLAIDRYNRESMFQVRG